MSCTLHIAQSVLFSHNVSTQTQMLLKIRQLIATVSHKIFVLPFFQWSLAHSADLVLKIHYSIFVAHINYSFWNTIIFLCLLFITTLNFLSH